MTKTLALTFIAAGLGAGIAGAQPPVTVYGSAAPTARVSYADLDLGSASGVERLQGRVRGAAKDLCLESAKADLSASIPRVMCYRTAVNDGYSQIDQLVANKVAGKATLTTAILISAR